MCHISKLKQVVFLQKFMLWHVTLRHNMQHHLEYKQSHNTFNVSFNFKAEDAKPEFIKILQINTKISLQKCSLQEDNESSRPAAFWRAVSKSISVVCSSALAYDIVEMQMRDILQLSNNKHQSKLNSLISFSLAMSLFMSDAQQK